jgi:hypothetical protein
MTERHPIRLVVTDDLRRSQLTVAFRIILVIPHLFWAGLFGVGAVAVAFVNWWATLIRGQSPRGLHDFLRDYLRYVTHIEAYLAIAANPYPAFFFGSSLPPYPVDLEVDDPKPQNRWKTAFRLVLAVPALLVAGALAGGSGAWGRASGYGYGGGVLATAAVLAWFFALFKARAPRGVRDLAAWSLAYAGQTAAYTFLLTDRYPYAGPEGHVTEPAPAAEMEGRSRLVVDDDLRRSRLTVAFRLLLAVPHLVWFVLWGISALAATIVNWVFVLVTARSPRPLTRFLSAYLRYGVHLGAFLTLVANPFPGFVGAKGSYPIDVEVMPSERQNRWVTLFRLVLAVPAFLMSGALNGVAFAVALLGWFASLARARMPEGLRNAGAHALRYQAQLSTYTLVLSDRYPFAGPVVAEPPPAAPPPGTSP